MQQVRTWAGQDAPSAQQLDANIEAPYQQFEYAAMELGPRAAAGTAAPQEAFFRLDPAGIFGVVSSLSVDAAGTLFATASDDKTIRLGSWPDGKLREVLRPPIGPRREGELWAVALTPEEGRVFAAVAAGGSRDGNSGNHVFSVRPGQLEGRLFGLPAAVMAIAVSLDGMRLAADLAGGGVRVWDAESRRQLYADTAYDGRVRGLAFDRRNDLCTTASDGLVPAHAVNGARIAALISRPGGMP